MSTPDRSAAAQRPVSRLPDIGTTIFTVMSALAAEHGAVNLGQGFPDFDGDPALMDAVAQAMRAGHNQYPPMAGVPLLRERVAAKVLALHGRALDPVSEITITAGATQALLTAILALVLPGDEVIVLEPAYDSYIPGIVMAGAVPVRVALNAGLRVDFDALARAITPRTRALIVNTPHNPGGTSWHAAEWQRLAELLDGTPIRLISDEVYEHMVYDGRRHHSALEHPGLWPRSAVVSSFGKTFHVTGWKVGYVLAPPALTAEFRKVHQFNVFTVNTPMQYGLAQHLGDPAHYLGLAAFYQAKRDRFRQALETTTFEALPCEATYFQCVRHPRIAAMGERAFCEWLAREIGVAAIPLSAFYADAREQGVVRFCFAKQEATLARATERLARMPV